MTPIDTPPMRVKAAEKFAPVSAMTILRALRTGALPGTRSNGKTSPWFVHRAALDAWIEQGCPTSVDTRVGRAS